MRLLPCALFALMLVVLCAGASPAAVAERATSPARVVGGVSNCEAPCPVLVRPKGTGTGRVTSAPPGIDCPPTCDSAFDETVQVTLRATASGTSLFLGWENCPQISGADCVLPPNSQVVICPNFAPRGSPSPPPGCPPEVSPLPPPPPPPAKPPPLGARCTIPGSPSGDVIRGTAANDVICSRGGKDRIYGGGGHDLLVGGSGNDKLYGGAGFDHLVGGAGADALYARDGAKDLVNGGRGRDRGRVDRLDRLRALEGRF